MAFTKPVGTGVIAGFLRHRDLIFQLTRREVLGKYRGSFGGLVWSLVHPLVMLSIYTFVFTRVFSARWTEGKTTADFALALFVGLILHGFFVECLGKAPGLVLGSPSYVTKIVFPLHILPYPATLAALFHAGMSLVVLFVAKLFVDGALPATAALLPLVMLLLAIQSLAWSWVVSALAVYVRDIGQVVGLLSTALLFLSPVFFPLDTLPSGLRGVAMVNPLTIPIEAARDVVLWGRLPAWGPLAAYLLVSAAMAVLAHALFNRMRRGFADVL